MPRALPESLAVLRRPGFRLLFGAQAVSVLGDRMVAVALAFAVLRLGGGASAVGLVLASRTLPLLACLVVGGVVADRTSPRATMVGADLSRVATQGALAALLIGGSPPIWVVAALSGATGAATGFFNPASTGLMPALVAPDELMQANGLRNTARAGGEIVGPAVAGVLVAAAGPGWAIGVDAATFAVSAAFLVRLRAPRATRAAPPSFLADLRAGWGEFRSRTWLWSLVCAAAVGNMLWGAWSALGPVVAARELGGARAWGGVLAAMGVGALLGGIVAIRARPRRPLVASVLVTGLFVVPLLLLAAGAGVLVLAVGALLAGLAMMLGGSLWESTLQREVPAAALSRVSSYDWLGSLAFQPLGLVMWGPLAAALGLSTALWLAAAGWAVTTIALLSVRDIRAMRGPATGRAGAPGADIVGA
jgi:predicted MFS family arabinose efflux permease